ncbi:leucine-rich repeat domain-containing protein [Kitasatospora sp. NPDC094015]|uniref:leucine-rich repeat domain-containing protein n=1 Tax=Kitasatospora sp. NPDC094015 TaxID=3155205 RepID=UPI00332182EA
MTDPLRTHPATTSPGPRTCTCFDQFEPGRRRRVRFHPEQQDTSAPGWLRLLDLIEEAATDGREVFRPLAGLDPQEREQIVTLPPTIARLTAVRTLNLYGSRLVRIPPEIGAMTALREFVPYTSYRLHWFPYELTRCTLLRSSTVSTRALYGNEKVRPPFPALRGGPHPVGEVDPGVWGGGALRACSVCDRPLDGSEVRQVWVSLRVATDVLPLLVNACSAACVAALPTPPAGHLAEPHTGGPALAQPPADY